MCARRLSVLHAPPALALLALVLVFTLSSCGSGRLRVRHESAPDQVVIVKSGPPPHAPAHGYRHKHEGKVDMTYDSGLGVYIVAGAKDCYFHDDHYLRLAKAGWEVSFSLAGPWQSAATKSLPPGLAKKYGGEPASKKGKKEK